MEIVPYRVPPPDFRYVWLLPGPAPAALTLAVGTIAVAGAGVGLWSAGHAPMSLALGLGATALAAVALARTEQRAPSRRGAREVSMAIVPWGVLVTPDTEPRVLRWPAIRKVSVDVTHTLRGGTPAAVASVVTVETDREMLAGRASGAVELERLMVSLEGWAEESARPVALDLDGAEPAETSATEPVAALLLRRAAELCSSSRGAARLDLPAGSYRTVAGRRAGPETTAALRAVLASAPAGAADPRPLAAALGAFLGAGEIVSDLVRLASSPHPIVAAFAKAAALRLGAARNKVGAVEEVAAFLFEEDLAVLDAWSRGESCLAHAGETPGAAGIRLETSGLDSNDRLGLS